MKKVFIGVGHGGTDPGAVGNGLREKDVNQEIALAMKAELEKNGVIVGISRLKDENDDIAEEIREANAFKPDLAIDVHTNAGGGKGFEALIQTNGYAASSKKLAECIEKEVKAIGQVSRGLKTRKNEQGTDYFGFLRQVKAPAIITECAFVDGDFNKIDTKEERVAFGQAYARGVLSYLGITAAKPIDKSENYHKVQAMYGFTDDTMRYLASFQYKEALFEAFLTKKPISSSTKEFILKYKFGKNILEKVYK